MTNSDTDSISGISAPENGARYHLYCSWACPFSHRVVSALYLTGLQDRFGYTWMRDIKREEGWMIEGGSDPAFGAPGLREIYDRAAPGIDHRPAVPLLLDLDTRRIVSTSSAEMTRFVSTGMGSKYDVAHMLCPTDMTSAIDKTNAHLHQTVNRAVYGVGFALEQCDYDLKVRALFDALDGLEARLSDGPFLFGARLTESDLYLFATLVRFDTVYYPLFKCSERRISDFPVLSSYLDRLMSIEELAATVDRKKIKQHYFRSLIHTKDGTRDLNPSGIVPAGPSVYRRDFDRR